MSKCTGIPIENRILRYFNQPVMNVKARETSLITSFANFENYSDKSLSVRKFWSSDLRHKMKSHEIFLLKQDRLCNAALMHIHIAESALICLMHLFHCAVF